MTVVSKTKQFDLPRVHLEFLLLCWVLTWAGKSLEVEPRVFWVTVVGALGLWSCLSSHGGGTRWAADLHSASQSFPQAKWLLCPPGCSCENKIEYCALKCQSHSCFRCTALDMERDSFNSCVQSQMERVTVRSVSSPVKTVCDED